MCGTSRWEHCYTRNRINKKDTLPQIYPYSSNNDQASPRLKGIKKKSQQQQQHRQKNFKSYLFSYLFQYLLESASVSTEYLENWKEHKKATKIKEEHWNN